MAMIADAPVRALWTQWLTGRTARVFAVRAMGLVALLAFEVVLARRLGPGGYGAFNFMLAIAIVAARLAPMGWLNQSTRLISRYRDDGAAALLKGALTQAHVTTLVGLLAAMALLVTIQVLWPARFAGLPLAPVLALMAGVSLIELHRFLLRGLHAGDIGEALPTLLLPLAVVALTVAINLGAPQAVAWLYAGICAALVALSSVIIARQLPAGFWHVRAKFQRREWAVAAAAMMAGTVSDELITRLPVLVLGSIGDEVATGLYQAAARLAIMTVFVLRVVTPVAAPTISVLHHKQAYAELRRAYLKFCLLAAMGALPPALLFMIAPDFILGWFGHEFREAAAILRILSIGYVASALTGPCATGLMMIGKERLYGALAMGNLAVTAIFTVVLAQLYGGLGAAIATAISQVAANAVYALVFWRSIRGAGASDVKVESLAT